YHRLVGGAYQDEKAADARRPGHRGGHGGDLVHRIHGAEQRHDVHPDAPHTNRRVMYMNSGRDRGRHPLDIARPAGPAVHSILGASDDKEHPWPSVSESIADLGDQPGARQQPGTPVDRARGSRRIVAPIREHPEAASELYGITVAQDSAPTCNHELAAYED